MDESLKNQAETLWNSIDETLDETIEASNDDGQKTQSKISGSVDKVMETVFNVISDVDLNAAIDYVATFKEKYPEATQEELVQKLIQEKCQRTGAVGAITSGTGLVPGLGTVVAVTLGVAADIGATFKLQAELVLEVAAVYEYPLTNTEKQRVILFITGLSAGTRSLTRQIGQKASLKLSEKFAEKAFLKAIPVIGMLAAAGTNVLSTYIIGQRADAYFRLGPEAVGSWRQSLRAISGVDERKITSWIAESSKTTGVVLSQGAAKVGKVSQTVSQKAGQTAGGLIGAVFSRTTSFMTRFIIKPGWAFVTFLPRQIIQRFRPPKPDNEESKTA